MKRIIVLLFLVFASPAWAMSPAILGGAGGAGAAAATPLEVVQSAVATGTDSIPFVLSGSPVVGNVLIAHVTCSSSITITTLSGWTIIGSATTIVDRVRNYEYYHIVVEGDGTDYTFSASGTDVTSGVIYEVQGANTTTPIDGYATPKTADDNYGDVTTNGVTPTVVGTLPLTFISTQTAQAFSAASGWTKDRDGAGEWLDSAGAHKNALTTDTETEITHQWTFVGETWVIVNLVLVAPQ